MKASPPKSRRSMLVSALCLSILAACGGGADDDHGSEDVRIDTSGRLAVLELNAPTVRIQDLDSNQVEATYTMANNPSAVYTSPGGRYAVVVQRNQDRVQFVDGGIYQEDHVNHLHDYKRASRMMSFALTGTRPTHYDVQHGVQAAIFMDGNATTTPAQNAGVQLFSDASIASGNTLARLDFNFAIHGLAEPVGNKLLTISRASDAPDTLPTHLVLYQRSGNTFTVDRTLPTRCNGMHGSFSSGSSTLVGCREGMLLVRHLSATTTSDGQLLATPLRVGTIAGHPRLPNHFIGVATEGTAPAPVTTRFYAVDAERATVSDFVPEGWTTGRVRRAHGFDRSGQRFFIVDDQGTLIVAQRQGSGWANLVRVPNLVPTMPTAAPFPAFAANGAKDEVYISDPQARQLIVVNSLTGAVIARRDLGFTPSGMAWLGITR